MSKLIIVPTPIGNLEDITLRAIRILKEADLILAEDTRTSGNLLKHYNIETAIRPFHQHNEHQQLQPVIEKLLSGSIIALVSDAGTPGISDAAFLLVRECIKNDIKVECLPGATAFVPALVCSGLPSDSFYFEGFLPQKKGRQSRLETLANKESTIIFYESTHRLLKLLDELCKFFGTERKASVARELTKVHEEIKRGTLKELSDYFKSSVIKGEIVVVVEGKK